MVVGLLKENFSGLTFNRPLFTKMMKVFKKMSDKPDLVLFTNWDRFSRDCFGTHIMINKLQKLGIEPQSIEQPLDYKNYDSERMLAVYLFK